MSKIVTLNAAGDAATVAPATPLDVLTTSISTTQALTGTLGLVQRGLFFASGMAMQNYRLGRGYNFLSAT